MIIYFLNCIITFFFGVLASRENYKYDSIKSDNTKYLKAVSMICILSMWVFLYAFRSSNVGSDTSGYMFFYNKIARDNLTLSQCLISGSDKLFEILRFSVNKLSKNNWIVFSIVTACMTYVPAILFIKKENRDYFATTLLLYITTLVYFSGFNAVRQAIAVSITLYAFIYYFREKKYFKYFISIAIATGFHSTAMFVIPFHMLSKLPLKSKALKIIIIAMIFSSLFFNSVWNIVISALSFVGNETLATRYANNNYTGSGYLRIIVALIPVVLGIWKYKLLKEKCKHIDEYLILLIFNSIFLLLSTHNWLFARLSSYFMPFYVLFLPRLNFIFKKNSRLIFIVLMNIVFLLYMFFLLLHGESNLYPYTFI